MASGPSRDRIAIPTVWVAAALSLGLHALLLWGWLPRPVLYPFDDPDKGRKSGALALRLAPPRAAQPEVPVAPSTRPAPAARSKPVPAPAPRRTKPAPPTAPVLAIEQPGRSAVSASAPPAQDFAALVESRRRARESSQPSSPAAPASPPPQPAESEQARHSRIVAENLGLTRRPSFGTDRRHGGGIFQIERMGYDSAEFQFFGWNNAIQRESRQVIEVRRGANPSMELAVVRRMIALIREQADGDFLWESNRLGRDVTLSARAADNAGLEDFLLKEFFPEYRRRN
ncbi:MAG: hypothetical protein ACT4P9_08170 [Betaproteobacteria bacterium]